MKLVDIIKKTREGVEIVVVDNTYDGEYYFFGSGKVSEMDDWEKTLYDLSKILDVVEILGCNKIAVNLTELVESHLKELDAADLFIHCNIDDIMFDMDAILAGYVSESWLKQFVSVLSK